MSSSSIQCERILTANLPTGSVPGEKFMFDAETPDSTEVGMSITNSKGKLLRVVDKSTTQKLANMQQQINVLSEKVQIDVPYNSEFIKNQIYPSKINRTSKKAEIYASFEKADGSDFIANTEHVVATLPSGYLSKNNFHFLGSASLANGASTGCARIAIFNNTIYVTPFVSCKAIMFKTDYEVV